MTGPAGLRWRAGGQHRYRHHQQGQASTATFALNHVAHPNHHAGRKDHRFQQSVLPSSRCTGRCFTDDDKGVAV